MLGQLFSRTEKASFTNIGRAFIASFALASLFAVLSVLCIFFFINERENDAKIINLAGRQRMLSEKLAKDIYSKGTYGSSPTEIRKDAQLWDSVHNVLRYGNAELGIPKPENPEIGRLFKEISPYQEKLYRSALGRDPAKLGGAGYGDIQQSEDRFLEGMDRIEDEFQADAEKGITFLKYIVAFLISLFLLFIFGLYRILVNPIVKMVKSLSEERKERAEQIRSILENTSDLIWSLDLGNRLLTFNSGFSKAIEAQTGTAPVIGKPVPLTGYPEETLKKWNGFNDRAFSGQSFVTQLEVEGQGATTFLELSFNPILDPAGDVTGCTVFSRDITERAETYKKLVRSEKNLTEAQDIADLGNWNWDIARNRIYWSDQLYRIFGQDPGFFEPDFEGLLEIVHPDDRKAFRDDVENSIEKGAPHDIVHRIVMGDGSIRYVHERGLVHFENGSPVRMAGTAQDVTVLENARLRIMRQYKELENFVHIISHNVRAPVSTLQGLVDIFEPDNPASNAEIIRYIGTTVDALDRTIKDLNHTLSLKDISEDSFGEVDLEDVIGDIGHLLAQDIRTSGAKIEHDFSEAPEAFGVRSYFTNILYNLVLNSIRHRADDRPPRIGIRSRQTALGGTEIIVFDNGKGMALTEGRRKKIFDMYGRLSGSTEGRGLGLYLVKTQVETMKGSISVESEPGKGSVFTIVFEGAHTPAP